MCGTTYCVATKWSQRSTDDSLLGKSFSTNQTKRINVFVRVLNVDGKCTYTLNCHGKVRYPSTAIVTFK